MAAPLSGLRALAQQVATGRLLGVPVRVALAVTLILASVPLYLRYFAWALGGCVDFWAPPR